MPHKHCRDKTTLDPSTWELPPTTNAQPLPVSKSRPLQKKRRNTDSSSPTKTDDTPRAFGRLFQPYRPPRSGQDDGTRPTKERKAAPSSSLADAQARPLPENHNLDELKIGPREPLSHFAARVDASLPFATLPRSEKRSDPVLKGIGKVRKTKNERKMQKMQLAWKEEERRRKEQKMAEGEDRGGAVDENGVEEMGPDDLPSAIERNRRGRKKNRKERAEDLWREIEANKRKEAADGARDPSKGLLGLHNVVQAPPRFIKRFVPGHAGFKAKDGGLKKQTEMSEARKSVINGYRAMMKQRREGIGLS